MEFFFSNFSLKFVRDPKRKKNMSTFFVTTPKFGYFLSNACRDQCFSCSPILLNQHTPGGTPRSQLAGLPVTSRFLLLELFLSESADATLWGEYSPSIHPGTVPGSLSPPTLSSSGPPAPLPPPPITAGATGGQASGALTRVSHWLNCQSALW